MAVVDWTILSPTYLTAVVAGARQLRRGFARGVADWLCLAAAPTFAIMALLTAVPGAPADMLCSAAPHVSALGGMAPMYWLMSAFHSASWLRWISSRRTGVNPR